MAGDASVDDLDDQGPIDRPELIPPGGTTTVEPPAPEPPAPRARTVLEALEVRSQLLALGESAKTAKWDTESIQEVIAETVREVEEAAGEVVYPEAAEQSRQIVFEGKRLRYSRKSGRFEEVSDEDPATIALEDASS